MATKFSLPKKLCDAVNEPPFRLQIAFDGNWMEAWRFAPDAIPDPEVVGAAIAGREADVAVEFCFKLNSGENFFFGQRRRGLTNDRETLQFVNRALACGRAREWKTLPDFLSRLEEAMPDADGIGKGGLCRSLDNMEIGITDWWRRGEVVEIWNNRSLVSPNIAQLQGQLDQFPSLHRNTINFVCLELNFQDPLHHWIGIEISEQDGGVHTLQVSNAYRWMVDCLSNYKVQG